ncbi:putative HhH-GPD family protein [Haloactinopolyspora alba]|uniref:Putative HhH-GPD family protein n=1 Tax=Haloactinopolyspora alba TaxID=648780 RepID=A0A2P8E2F8_9ACTN|nr:HhH-GPD-type base excision DNA repair protein [Haloactinopolyspora alba]PSL03670.1 putative HhH-GPD family protein [Haloactinopolyspora alba]
MTTLYLAGDADADALLARDPFALLVGMLLDQQVPMEKAFAGPAVIVSRLGTETLDPAVVVDRDPDEFAELVSRTPAVHRFPGAMAGRIQKLASYVVEEYDGDAAAIWTGAHTGAELLRRLKALPGFGAQKAAILVALLGKQFDVRPDGWREAAGAYGEEGASRSVADVVDDESLARVRATKREAKRAAKA